MELQTFYATFGQTHIHDDGANKDRYIKIFAENVHEAQKLMIKYYDTKWGTTYEEEKFDPSFYPDGLLHVLIQFKN